MKYIKDYKEKELVDDVYMVKKSEIKQKNNGDDYRFLVVEDKTGEIISNVWEINNPAFDEVNVGDFVRIKGSTYTYNDEVQIKPTYVKIAKEEEYNFEDFIKVSRFDRNDMKSQFLDYVESVQNKYLHALLKKFFVDTDGELSKFLKHPAAKTVHHSFVGGLLEHSLSVTKICDKISKEYDFVNRDLLLTGAMLHDIGKLYEMTETPNVEYTDQGQFLGHIIIGVNMVHDKVNKIENFPAILEQELEHLILSHHGEYEFGSPKKPELVEAYILNKADEIDAKLEIFRTEIDKLSGDKWSSHIRFLDTPIRRTIVPEE